MIDATEVAAAAVAAAVQLGTGYRAGCVCPETGCELQKLESFTEEAEERPVAKLSAGRSTQIPLWRLSGLMLRKTVVDAARKTAAVNEEVV